jgi:hypothetical protein
MRLWNAGSESGKRRDSRSTERWNSKLWMPNKVLDKSGKPDTRDVEAPSVCGVPFHGRPMQATDASSVEELRGPGYNRLFAVARRIREFLGGYGGQLRERARPRSQRQQWWVLEGKLPLDHQTSKYYEQAQHGNARRRAGAEQSNWDRPHNTVQPTSFGMASSTSFNTAGLQKQVYDIKDCGPRHRFVVRGTEAPFIVHNCCQALARDVLAEVNRTMHLKHAVNPALLCHDEFASVVPTARADEVREKLDAAMRAPTSWWPELIKWSESETGANYGATH